MTRQPVTHYEKIARVGLLRALNELGADVGRNRTIGQMTRGDDEGNAMLDQLAIRLAAHLRANPLPPSSDTSGGDRRRRKTHIRVPSVEGSLGYPPNRETTIERKP